jgi:hypothetical protein
MTRSQPMRFSQFRIRLVTTGRGCGGSCSGSTAGRPPRGTPRIAKENREAVGCHSAVSFWMEFLGGFLTSRGISHSFYHVFFSMIFLLDFVLKRNCWLMLVGTSRFWMILNVVLSFSRHVHDEFLDLFLEFRESWRQPTIDII